MKPSKSHEIKGNKHDIKIKWVGNLRGKKYLKKKNSHGHKMLELNNRVKYSNSIIDKTGAQK